MTERNLAHSVEPLNNRIQRLEMLLEIGRNLSALLDLQPLLQMILDAASDLTDCQEASILLHDPEEDNLYFAAAPWSKQEKMRSVRVPINGSAAGKAFSTGVPVIISNAEAEGHIFRDVDMETGFNTHSLMAVPMKFKGETSGVLTAVNKQQGSFSEDDRFVLENLASQAAIGIQNARQMEATEKAYQDLADLDRMKMDFIAITSHELRTPLGLILGHATFLKEITPEDFHDQLDVIVENSLRLKEIIEDISKVNSYQMGESRLRLQAVEANSLLRAAGDALSEFAQEKNILLKYEPAPHPLTFQADEEKLLLALSHIIRNAIIYNQTGGIVVMRTYLVDEHINFEITDTGIGIGKKDIPLIFERFFQVEDHMTRYRGGMGLGLSVALTMVKMHQGQIVVRSELGEGSTFTISIPLQSA